MMSADNAGLLYSGLPQDDWQNRPKCPKIHSNGPNLSRTSGKAARKTRTKTFLLIIFSLCVVALMLVLGFHIYETPKNDLLNFWGRIVGQPSDKHNGSVTTEAINIEVDPLKDKDERLENSHHDEGLEKESNEAHVAPETTFQPTITTTPNKDILPPNPQNTDITKAPERPEVNTNPPTTPTTLRTTTSTPKLTTAVLSTSTVLSLNSGENSVEAKKKDVSQQTERVNTSASKQENYEESIMDKSNYEESIMDKSNYEESIMDKSNSTMNVTNLDNESLGDYNNNTSHLKLGVNNGSIAGMVIRLTSEYFNTTTLKEDQIKQWFEHLISKPSVEVIAIAAVIIFVGLSLLIIGIACGLSKRNKLHRRREKIGKATKDVDSNEKIILLTDDVSEDEFVKA